MYRVRSSGEVKSQGEIRKMFPNVSLPRVWSADVCNQLGIDPVFESPAPEVTRYQTAVQSGVVQDANGKWVWNWVIGPVFTDNEEATAEEQEAAHRARIDEATAKNMRDDRDRRLAQTDWMALSDNTLTQDWAAYRQALRDLPSQEGFPYNVVWPVRPDTVVWPQPE